MDGYEADDIIGTIATQMCTKGFEVYMMTPDKDFGQLVNECVFLYKPAYMGNAVDVLGVKEVCEKWDISDVSQVVDMLGLQGDSSDNIPGIPGFGPKTAATLLKQYGTVENIVAHAADLKGKQKDLVLQYGDQAILSKKLARIITDVPVEFDEEGLKIVADVEKSSQYLSTWNQVDYGPGFGRYNRRSTSNSRQWSAFNVRSDAVADMPAVGAPQTLHRSR